MMRGDMRVVAAVLTAWALCSACATAAGLPPDLPAAESMATKHEVAHSAYYEQSLKSFFYENVLNQCVQHSFDDKTPLSFVIAIDESGKAAKTYWSAQTRVGKCLETVVSKTSFPKPPVVPFLVHFDISFERRK
jgi:hypothetical protein